MTQGWIMRAWFKRYHYLYGGRTLCGLFTWKGDTIIKGHSDNDPANCKDCQRMLRKRGAA